MAKLQFTFKRAAIDQTTQSILIIVGAASVLSVFCLAGSRALFAQMRYQNKVIKVKQEAIKKLNDNIKSVETLNSSYQAFNSAHDSIIGTPDQNSKIVLDALPSQYDFPALASSMQKLLGSYGAVITGSDEELSQVKTKSSQVVEIPLTISANNTYTAIQNLINDLNRSIRPMKILSISLSGSQNNMNLSLSIKTYYQTGKTVQFTVKEVK